MVGGKGGTQPCHLQAREKEAKAMPGVNKRALLLKTVQGKKRESMQKEVDNG